MKTFMASPATIDRKWYVVDAEGKTLGRLASEVAKVLRGKNKAIFTPHIDTGDYVIVVNAGAIIAAAPAADAGAVIGKSRGGVTAEQPERHIDSANLLNPVAVLIVAVIGSLIGLGPSGLLWLAPFPQGMQLPDPLPSKVVGIVVAAPQGILPFDAVAHPVVYVGRHHFPRRPRNPGQPVLRIVGIARLSIIASLMASD